MAIIAANEIPIMSTAMSVEVREKPFSVNGAILIFGYLDIWIFGYLDIWIFGYLDIWTIILFYHDSSLVWK